MISGEQVLLLMGKLNPAYVLMFTGLFLHKMPKKIFRVVSLVIPTILMFLIIFASHELQKHGITIATFYLKAFHINPYSRVIALSFLLVLFLASIYSFSIPKAKIEVSAAFFYVGCAIGVVFAGDLVSFFLMWELMTIGSAVILFEHKTNYSYKAAMRFIQIHLIGGAILLTGISLHLYLNGSLEIPRYIINIDNFFHGLISLDYNYLAPVLMMIGILINVAVPPFSSWLPDSYSSSSPLGSVFLSSYTTKTAIFALLTIFSGSTILIPLGVFMIFYGIIYAILANDIRKLLSYSIINQIGFMVVAIGVGSEMALAGAILHLICHLFYNLLFFMIAGAILLVTGKSKISDIGGGLYHSMKITSICTIVAAMCMAAFPFTLEFIAKSLILDSVQDNGALWIILVGGAAGVVLHGALKFPWLVFFDGNSELKAKDPPYFMLFAMIATSIICVLSGIFPRVLYELIPLHLIHNPYTSEHVFGHLQLLLFSSIAFFLMLPFLRKSGYITLDFDWIYRVLIYKIIGICGLFFKFLNDGLKALINKLSSGLSQIFNQYFGEKGTLSHSYGSSLTINLSIFVMVILIILGYIIPL